MIEVAARDAPQLVKLKPLSHRRLAVEFSDGQRGIARLLEQDLRGRNARLGDDDTYFAQAFVRDGDAVWPGGERACALALAHDARFTPAKVRRDPLKPRYFLDTEFTDFNSPQLISLAIVGEDGREFYAEVSDFDRALCSDFVRQTVLPQLGNPHGRAMPFHQVRRELLAWLAQVPVKPRPVLCFDYDDDLKLVEHLIGGPLPKGWKTENVYNWINDLEKERFFMDSGLSDHHALHDARANEYAFI